MTTPEVQLYLIIGAIIVGILLATFKLQTRRERIATLAAFAVWLLMLFLVSLDCNGGL